jgi:hypothetical protein
MGLVINPESEYAKELARWNTPKRDGGFGPDGYEPYPRMVYQAIARNGKAEVGDPADEQFSARCQLIVRSEAEYDRARAQGWRATPTEALAHAEALQIAIATAAAEASFAAQRMTPKAQAERAALEAKTDKHVTK